MSVLIQESVGSVGNHISPEMSCDSIKNIMKYPKIASNYMRIA
jgi:hypothetical protein